MATTGTSVSPAVATAIACSAGPKDADTQTAMSAYRKRNVVEELVRTKDDQWAVRWMREEEYVAKLSPISEPVLPRHLRNWKENGPLLYFGFQLGIDVAEYETQVDLFIEHINRHYRGEMGPIEIEKAKGSGWHEAIATAFFHIVDEAKEIDEDSRLNCEPVKVVSDMYHPDLPTTVTFVLCSNDLTYDPYTYFGRDKVEKLCEVMKAVLNLGDDATPKWYFSYKRHGAKAHNFEPFNQPRTQPPLKAEKATRPSS